MTPAPRRTFLQWLFRGGLAVERWNSRCAPLPIEGDK